MSRADPRPLSDPRRRQTVERDGRVFSIDAETAATHAITTALVLGFAVYAWRVAMPPEEIAKRIGGAGLAYLASRRLTILFGDWRAWRLRGAATLWLPFDLQFAASVVSLALALQLPRMERDGIDLKRRLFGLPSQLLLAAAVYAAFVFGAPHLPPELRALLWLDTFGGTFSSVNPKR